MCNLDEGLVGPEFGVQYVQDLGRGEVRDEAVNESGCLFRLEWEGSLDSSD